MLNATIVHYPKLFKEKKKKKKQPWSREKKKHLQSEIQNFGIFAGQMISNYFNKTEGGLIEFSPYSYQK